MVENTTVLAFLVDFVWNLHLFSEVWATCQWQKQFTIEFYVKLPKLPSLPEITPVVHGAPASFQHFPQGRDAVTYGVSVLFSTILWYHLQPMKSCIPAISREIPCIFLFTTVDIGYCDYHLVTNIGYCDYFLALIWFSDIINTITLWQILHIVTVLAVSRGSHNIRYPL